MRLKGTWTSTLLLWSMLICSNDAFLSRAIRSEGNKPPQLTSNEGVSALSAASITWEQPVTTVLIPAFNEELRIKTTLEDIDEYLASSSRWKNARVLVVDDGSSDSTVSVIRQVATESGIPIECISMLRNEGKGAALSFGMHHVYEKNPQSLVLAADADGSGDISCIENLYRTILSLSDGADSQTTKVPWSDPAIVVGYRTQAGEVSSRMGFRKAFRSVVKNIVGDLGVSDSQCGFKLMTAAAGARLYNNLSLKGWTHDVEVLYKCKALGIPLAEAEVIWQDKAGSKLVASPGGIWAVTFQMLLDVILIRVVLSRQWRSSLTLDEK